MAGLVDVVLPSGEVAPVAEGELTQALIGGAHVASAKEVAAASSPEQAQVGGLLGQVETGLIGAARTASMGFSDAAFAEMGNIVGGEGLRKDTLKAFDLARNANPYSNMAGEMAGMLVGGPTAAGEALEVNLAERVGSGLLGRAATMGARGALEGAAIGWQHEVSEATLGDHELNGEKVAAATMKDGLLGGALGAGLGLAMGGVSRAAERLRKPSGPMPASTLDEIAGVPGAGRELAEDAASAQRVVEDLKKAGATTEQAAKMADEVMTLSRTGAKAGPLSGLIDDAAGAYAARRAGANATMGETLAEAYSQRAKKLAERAQVIDDHALKLKSVGDRVMRAEDVLNEVQFKYKADQMAGLVDKTKFAAQRDLLAANLQKTKEVLDFWGSTASKGGAEGAIKSLQKQYDDALFALAKVEDSGSAAASKDFFVRADQFKRSIDKLSQYGKSPYGLPEAVAHPEMGLRGIGDMWRSSLEDASVWGNAGMAQKEWNATFSNTFARRQDFGGRFAARIDEVRGVPVAEMDAEKVKNALLKKLGSEADAQQALKSTDAWMAGNKDRIAAIKKYGDLSPKELAALEDGTSALGEFESTLGAARKESEVIARIEQMQLEEQGKAVGGLLGLGADFVARPMTTIERLGALRAVTKRVEEGISNGMKRFFGKNGPAVIDDVRPRPKADVVADIGEVKRLAGNPAALDAQARAMVGDMAEHAPKTANSAMLTAKRALLFLAQEAPRASVSASLIAAHNVKPRYSDQQVSEWETKKRAALDPTSVVEDMKRGKLNREAIRTVEFVSPKLYAEMQRSAQEYIAKLATQGKLDNMPRQQQAVLATLLKVPADGTWKPDFIALMQAAKATPAPQQAPAPGAAGPTVVSKRAIKINTGAWETEAQSIEAR